MKDGRDPMRKVSWKVRLAGALLLLSVLLYLLQWLLFSNPGVMTVWFLNEIAFLPVEVLIVYLVFQKVFENRERRDRLRKVNMLIGIFFSDLGACALEVFAGADPDVESIRASTLMRAGWGSEDFRNACSSIEPHPFRVDPDKIDLVAFRDTLSAKRDILVKLLENPSLLEHESFSESLLSVFHVIEELDARKTLPRLNRADAEHIAADMQRAYRAVFGEWIVYMRHLKENYPYLYSFKLRTNPFDPDAVVEIPDIKKEN
jgi:hypothetical protein